jgi:carbamoyl-phosphate synthase small subunit
MPDPARPALLVLETGQSFRGVSVGATGERGCELVFHTGMTGYQEILTDPSYCGQGVVMTYPQIGNYGCQPEADESDRCWAEAMVMNRLSPTVSSWTATQDLASYLAERDVIGVTEVDTRELTLLLREQGALRAMISTERDDVEALAAQARALPSLEGQNLAKVVSCREPYRWEEGLPRREDWTPGGLAADAIPVACLDFGIKRNILRNLVSAGFAPTVLPWDTPAEEVLASGAAAVLLSNGPGDPAAVDAAIASVRTLAGSGLPLFGICLGHQILALALGGRTYKMKFGHHGANHPVVEDDGGRIDISSQNHGFAVDGDSLEGTGLAVTHWNGNDRTVAGLRHRELPCFSVQYHPEGAPGPHDPAHLFQRFRALCVGAKV